MKRCLLPSARSWRRLSSVIVLGLCLFGAGQRAAADCVAPPANMVSWWPGDGNTNDIQGTNTGTLQGNATFASGKVSQAFSLNPSVSNGTGTDFVTFGNPAPLKITG